MKIKIKSKINPPYSIKNIKIGDKKNFEFKITKKIHNSFKNFSGDKSPLHTSVKFCKKNGYKNLLGYAFLIEVLLSKIFGMHFPGGSELCLHQTSKFIKPFYLNDKFDIKIKVTQKNFKAKLITLDIKIYVKKKIIYSGETILNLTLEK